MASLANASPPIALGALDGRYRARRRAARRPPVRGGAQPRARAGRGRVADPPDRPRAWCPGVRAPHRRRAVAALRAGRRGLRPRRGRRAGRDRARDRARRQGRRVLPQAPPRRASSAPSDGPRRADPLRLHQRGHQQPVLRAHGAAARSARSGCPGPPPSSTPIADMARDLRDVPLLAHTHGQPATPTTMGKELAVLAAPAAPAAAPHRRRRVPRQAQRRHRHVRRAPRRGARRRLARRQPRVRRGPRA